MDPKHPHGMTPPSTETIRRSVSLRGDPARLPIVLTNVLVIGFALLAVTGLVELVAERRVGSLVQPVAAGALIVWAQRMKAKGRPRPELLLIVAIALSFGYLVLAAVDPTTAEITDTSPIAIIVGAGVIGLVAGGDDSRKVGIVALAVIAGATVMIQTRLGTSAVEVVVDAANSVIVMTIALLVVRSVRLAVDDGVSRYAGLIDSTPVAVIEVDLGAYLTGGEEIRIRRMNPIASRVVGYEDGRTETTVPRRKMPEVFSDVLDRAAAAPTGSATTTLPDGRTFQVGWRVDPITDWVVLSGTDVTAQRRAERELSDQVSARDRFIASVSHELRTPLAGAIGLLELIHSGEVAGEERDEMIGLALLQVRDMSDIVEDLLVAARAASGRLTVHPAPMDVTESVRSVLAVVPERFELVSDDGTQAMGDPVRVRQIVKNLVTNALRYGGERRRILVVREQGQVVVEARDSGQAIDPALVERMFEPYEQGAEERLSESVGLGLSVARTLARLMDGDLIYLHDGEAVFRLTLPAADQPI